MNADAPGPQPAETSPLAEETDSPAARVDWRSTVVATTGIILLAGLWLIASPAALDYDKPSLPLIWGAVIVVLALIRLLAPAGSRLLAVLLALGGALTVLSGFAADDKAGETANMAVMGGAVVILALIGLAAESDSARTSRP